jgi:hypothetical protein
VKCGLGFRLKFASMLAVVLHCCRSEIQIEDVLVAGVLGRLHPASGTVRAAEDPIEPRRGENDALRREVSRLRARRNLLNYHRAFPRTCGAAPTVIAPELTDMFNRVTLSSGVGHINHAKTTSTLALRPAGPSSNTYMTQVCQYAFLDQWTLIARSHNLTKWTASGGSLISSRCFNSMNPWDDDIDIVVAPSDCIKLQSIWQAGKATNGPEHVFYHRVGWDHRVLGNLVIHTRAYGDTERAIFKFRQLNSTGGLRASEISDLGGIDVMCSQHVGNERRQAQRISRFTEALDDGLVSSIEFGPTTIQMVPAEVADRYLKLRNFTCSGIVDCVGPRCNTPAPGPQTPAPPPVPGYARHASSYCHIGVPSDRVQECTASLQECAQTCSHAYQSYVTASKGYACTCFDYQRDTEQCRLTLNGQVKGGNDAGRDAFVLVPS